MAYTTIDDPTIYFNTKLYTGTGSSNALTGIGFQPDWVWLKSRSAGWDHEQYDSVRGVGKSLSSVTTNAEQDSPQGVTAFGADGFTVGTRSGANENNSTYVAWNWLGGGSASSNSNGSITSSVSVNTTAGFSIVSYTGTGSNATVGHGLGAVPKMYIARNITDTEQWTTYHAGMDATAPQDYHLRLNTTDARVNEAEVWNDTAPTSSVFSVGSSGAPNGNGDNHIAYCFAEKKGYSKFGSYKGTSNADGTFVYTGFRPAFIITKATTTGQSYQLYDNKRNTFNQSNKVLFPNHSYAEQDDSSAAAIDILSNGFKQRVNDAGGNSSSHTYIYWAFAESPFVNSNGVPTNAR